MLVSCNREGAKKQYAVKLSIVGDNTKIWFWINQNRVDLTTDEAYSGDTLKINIFNAHKDVSATLYVDKKEVWHDSPNPFKYILK